MEMPGFLNKIAENEQIKSTDNFAINVLTTDY